ncbi:hypothetical protein GCM10029978_043200 [Actinoallomurus acanthiterrae]
MEVSPSTAYFAAYPDPPSEDAVVGLFWLSSTGAAACAEEVAINSPEPSALAPSQAKVFFMILPPLCGKMGSLLEM